jgi:hypothetical protein
MGSQRKSKRGFIREVIEGVRQRVAVYQLQRRHFVQIMKTENSYAMIHYYFPPIAFCNVGRDVGRWVESDWRRTPSTTRSTVSRDHLTHVNAIAVPGAPGRCGPKQHLLFSVELFRS